MRRIALLCLWATMMLIGCGKRLATEGHSTLLVGPFPHPAQSIAVTPDGAILVQQARGPILRVPPGETAGELLLDGTFQSMALSPDGRTLAITEVDTQRLLLLDLASQELADTGRSSHGLYGWVGASLIHLEPSGPWPNGRPGRIVRLDPSSGAQRILADGMALLGWPQPDGAISPDGSRLILTTGHSGMLQLHTVDLETGAVQPYEETGNYGISPRWLDDQTVIYGNWGQTFLLDITTGLPTPFQLAEEELISWKPLLIRAGQLYIERSVNSTWEIHRYPLQDLPLPP